MFIINYRLIGLIKARFASLTSFSLSSPHYTLSFPKVKRSLHSGRKVIIVFFRILFINKTIKIDLLRGPKSVEERREIEKGKKKEIILLPPSFYTP